ncbi:MAG TPA: sigma-E processing peptidase SpoIIGA [Clostridiaceae bacterium]|nr:sigma-E processing peptidase SpoIIGA [Clostridiaceae bacterium]
MVVYADILFFENLLANCLILKLTSAISGFALKTARMIISSAIGAIYAVLAVMMPSTALLSALGTRVIVSVLMVLVAFRIRNISEFLRRWGMMLLSAFLLAGSTYALSSILEGWSISYGGLMYISPQGIFKAFMLSAGLCIVLVRPIGRILSGKAFKEGSIIPVYITMGNKSVRLHALVDTGNSLIDPITGYPVMVVEADSIKTILPPEIYSSVLSNNIGFYTQNSEESAKNPWLKRVHLIPFKSIGKENGMLTGFRPDAVRVGKEGTFKELNDVIVGICGIKLSNNDKYSALVGPAALSKI